MNGLSKVFLLAFLQVLALLPPSVAYAQLEFKGTAAYEVRDGLATVTFDQLNHIEGPRITGTLYFQLVAMTTNSASGAGYKLASIDLPTLARGAETGSINFGSHYHDVVFTTTYTPPPAGDYYLYLIAVEYPEMSKALASISLPGNPVRFNDEVSNPADVISNEENYSLDITDALRGALGGEQTHKFSIYTSRTGELELFTSGETDTVGKLFLKNGATLLLVAEDDDGGDFLNFSLRATVPAGEYELQLTSFDGKGGAYTVVSNFTPTPERNNAFVQNAPTERAGGRFSNGLTTGSNATFAVGMLKKNSSIYTSSALSTDTVRLHAVIRPEPQHVGRFADIYVVDRVNLRFTMLNRDGVYLSWDARVPNLVPYKESVVLTPETLIEIHNGALKEVGDHRYFVGYMIGGDFLRYSPSPVIFDIKRYD